MTLPRAIIWDVDGTLAETERDGHRAAFNEAFARHELPWRWDEAHYGRLLRIAGGRERLVHDLERRHDAPPDVAARQDLAAALHRTKNALYAGIVGDGRIPLRPGVRELMQECRQRRVPMAIATTSSRDNVDSLLSAQLGPDWATWFAARICGEDVARKKPYPDAYDQAVSALGIPPGDVVAIEDSPDGVAAARAAGVPAIVTRSHYFGELRIDGAVAVGPGLGQREGWQPAPAAGRGGTAHITLEDIADWLEHE